MNPQIVGGIACVFGAVGTWYFNDVGAGVIGWIVAAVGFLELCEERHTAASQPTSEGK